MDNEPVVLRPVDIVIQRVGEKLNAPSQLFSSISRVPDFLRKFNEKAYEPKMLAIGPYHHYQDHLSAFEKQKISYLHTLLNRTGSHYSDYVKVMWALEERARNCYGGSISLGKNEFVQMMLVDGCFIVEVIRKFGLPHLRGDDDPIFKQGWMLPHIARDMILLENQLPFFVLSQLFKLSEMPNIRRNESFLETILLFFNGILREKGCRRDVVYHYPITEIKYLLHLIHDIWLPSPAGVEADELHNHTVDRVHGFICSATEIQKAGIQFLKIRDDSLFDSKFENQCSHDINLKHATHYIKFLKCLINSSKDAELLCCRGIIANSLGDDEVTAALFNNLCDCVVLDERFYCNRPRNRWMAELRQRHENLRAWLRHYYFSTRWAIISSVCGYFLLSTSAKSLSIKAGAVIVVLETCIKMVVVSGCVMQNVCGKILTPKECNFINRN
ncbi:DUF862 domain-containing protein [Citrus sinensis]|uniref:DUF862 domain-containing protein n=1 Tax=Citrus sinensis TaxID=2711 RepID=A0ACB8I1Y7_CITSI|nr:DUF862 domain-containing protein [Citrus sinensis]